MKTGEGEVEGEGGEGGGEAELRHIPAKAVSSDVTFGQKKKKKIWENKEERKEERWGERPGLNQHGVKTLNT